MSYYKIKKGGNIVGVSSSENLCYLQPKHLIYLCCDEDSAQYIWCNGVLYRANWFVPETKQMPEVIRGEDIEIAEITEDEYNAFSKALETEQVIKDETAEEEQPIIPPTNEDVEYVRQFKIEEMSRQCNKTITFGFDTVLSDGEKHHFSLTEQDQLNLISLSITINTAEFVPYHADGELCKYYSREDILKIVEVATSYKAYNTTYFNSLKKYINSLNTVEEIGAIYYGVDIPEEYQSDVLKEIYSAA